MSSIATYASAQPITRTSGRGRFAKVGLAAVAASTLANVIFYYLGSVVVNYHPDFVILSNVSGAIIFTLVAAVIAVGVYGALVRYTENAVRNFKIVSAIVLVLSIVPDYTMILDEPGSSVGQATILALMHVVAAAIIVPMLTILARPEAR